MKHKELRDSESAVSEVVDFIIILSVMLLAVSVIAVQGFPLVEHLQESGHTENLRQGFTVVAANLNKIVFGKAPSQSVELKMYGGSLSVTGSSTINVTSYVWNSSKPGTEAQTFERQMRMLEKNYEGNSICYENTGTWAKYPSGNSVMLSEPQFSFNGNTLIVPASMIAGSSSTGGSGLVSIISDGGERWTYSYQNVSRVDITITSKYYQAWESYLEETMGMNTSVDDVNSTVHAQRLYSENIDVHAIYSPMTVKIE